MTFSLTGIAYLILSLAIGFLAYRFFQYWQQKKDTVSRLFFYFILSLLVFTLYKTVACLFFVDNQEVLISSTVVAVFMEGLAASIVTYLVTHLLKLSRLISSIGFFIVFIYGIYATWLTAIKPYSPYIESTGSINWGFLDAEIDSYFFIRLSLLLIAFIPLVIILIQQYKKSSDRNTKDRAIGLGFALIVGVIIGFLDFFVLEILKFSAISRDIIMSILGAFLFVVIYFTQKPPSDSEKI
jgi:hypothetical protein